MFKVGSMFLDVSKICKKTPYQILSKLYLIACNTLIAVNKHVTFDKLFII